jgi:hypothetical protein
MSVSKDICHWMAKVLFTNASKTSLQEGFAKNISWPFFNSAVHWICWHTRANKCAASAAAVRMTVMHRLTFVWHRLSNWFSDIRPGLYDRLAFPLRLINADKNFWNPLTRSSENDTWRQSVTSTIIAFGLSRMKQSCSCFQLNISDQSGTFLVKPIGFWGPDNLCWVTERYSTRHLSRLFHKS